MYVHHIYICVCEYHVYHWDISHLSRDSNQQQPFFLCCVGNAVTVYNDIHVPCIDIFIYTYAYT